MTVKIFDFHELPAAPLLVDAIYRGGRAGNAGDDPLGRLLKVSNSGGFRYRGTLDRLELVCLTTSMSDPDWPDSIDRETGVFTYFGDNKHPGRSLHDTPRKGNQLLARIFEDAQNGTSGRARVPPVLLFANTGDWRDVEFLGLAVPGTDSQRSAEDLVAIWRVAGGKRFQNYRARFTVLAAGELPRAWLDSIIMGSPQPMLAPDAFQRWIATGRFLPLNASRTIEYRSRREQLPQDVMGLAIIQAIYDFFSERPHAFEYCAATLARMMLPDVAALDLTRPSRDGGRDAIGKMRIGVGPGAILVDFALEAKCYSLDHSVGVREISRVISRLRHRQFGMLVTTSWVDSQAYREIKDDQHPVIIVSAVDIVAVLRAHGMADEASVAGWLAAEFATVLASFPSVKSGST